MFCKCFSVSIHKHLKETPKRNVFGNVFHVFSVLVPNTLQKTLKRHVSGNGFNSPVRVFCMHFSVLVLKNVKNTQNTFFFFFHCFIYDFE